MRPLVAAWRRGEGTQAAIAARHGMPTPSFAWWCQRLAGERAGAPDFVAVDVVPEEVEPTTSFEVTCRDGRSVRVAPDFDAEALSRLLAVLERPC